MPYSQTLALRVRQTLRQTRGIRERRMFGGLAFFLHGNLLVGVWDNALIVRLGADRATWALQQPHVGPFDGTGRPMKGWILVEPDGLESDRDLAAWIDDAVEFVTTLPAK